MLLGTFQPFEDDPSKRSKHYKGLEEYLGYYPVFCFPARTKDEALWGAHLAAPMWPERFILFESEDYNRMDLVIWNEIAYDNDSYNAEELFSNVSEKYAEYVVPEITNVIDEISPHEFIFDIEFCGPDADGMHELNVLQRKAQEAVWNLERQIPGSSQFLTLIAEKDAFVQFIMQLFYLSAVNNGKFLLEEAYPLFPNPDISNSIGSLWNLCANDVFEMIDEVCCNSRPKFDEMYSAMTIVQKENARAWAMLFAKACGIGRNNPCFCGSGKKFKKCHLNPKIELRIGA